MLIKVGDIYLDTMPGQSIEIERKVKLFEDISTADGDFSYSFDLPPTSKNISSLGIQDINISAKALYNEIQCDLQNLSGITLYKGVIKIEKFNENIQCSFYSGNYEWMSLIDGSLKDLDLSEYDTNNTLADIELTWDNTSGIIFPLFDKGKLEERIAPSLVFDERIGPDLFLNNDFHPWLFVKDIFIKIFRSSRLKITGPLLNDFVYNNLIITNNSGNSQEILEARTAYVGKTSTQSISSGSFVKLTWIDNVDPYYDGDENNFDDLNDKYVADIDMVVNVTFMLDFDIPSSTQRYDVELRKNGTAIFTVTSYWTEHVSGAGIHELVAGDELELYVKPFTSTGVCQVGSFFKIEVTKVKKVFAVNVVPSMSKIDLVKNIFKLLNVVPTYDPYSKTVNLELFKNIRHKQPQDISRYLSGNPVIDYYEFINEYGRKNKFLYTESASEEIEEYDETSTEPYGSGNIDLDNVYLQEEQTIVELDFVPPFQYLNEPFQMSLVKLDYLGDDETEEDVIDSVTDSSGVARFNFSGVPPFSTDAGDIVRIKTTSTGVYLGTGIVSASAIGWFELAGVQFNGTCTGTFVKINYTENSNTDPVIALCLSNTSVSGISSLWSSVYVNESSTKSTPIAYAYFFRHYQGGIDADGLKLGLSFGDITGNGFYQQNIIETYYRDYEHILSDPVKVIGNFLFPESVFLSLDFTTPVRLNSIIGPGIFLINKISGYKSSHLPCEVELIKL